MAMSCNAIEWMDGWMDEWMDGWMDEWMVGWMDASIVFLCHKEQHQ